MVVGSKAKPNRYLKERWDAFCKDPAPDLPPVPGVHATFARDHEYKRYGTLSLLAGIDLLTGKVHALVRDRHRSKEFIEFLKLLDAAYRGAPDMRR